MDQENLKRNSQLKRGELNRLLRFHDTAIERQKQQIQKYETGKWKSTTCSVEILVALATADLKLLQSGKDKVLEDIKTIENELTS